MNIHLFWFGGELSLLEKLTLKSILFYGHTPVVWAYNTGLFEGLDKKIIINDANDIIKKENSFLYKGLGTTKPSFGCGFTDVFRAKLLYDVGGWYFDFDVTLNDDLSDFKNTEFVFRKHNITPYVPNIIKAPKGCKFLKDLYNIFSTGLNENNSDFFKPLKMFSFLIEKYNFSKYGVDCFGNDDCNYVIPLFVNNGPTNLKAIHWCNGLFKDMGFDLPFFKGSINILSKLKKNNLIKGKKIFFDWNTPIKDSFYSKKIKEYEV